MKISKPPAEQAVTLIEVLAVVAFMALFVFVYLPMVLPPRHHCTYRVSCVNNLKNIGLGHRTFAVDYGGQYPWNVDTNSGGFQLPPVGAPPSPSKNVFFLLAVLSNELSTPKIILCPTDTRKMATNTWEWGLAQGANAAKIPSYFIGTSATEEQPQSILSGDRNLLIPSIGLDFTTASNYNKIVTVKRADVFSTNTGTIGWSSEIHNHGGNILLGDGSVQQESDVRARDQLRATITAMPDSFDLFFPAL
jgi:prepilin-type processing-associated H-X9-DG protein